MHSKPDCSYTFYYDPDNGHCYCKRLDNTCREIGVVPYSRYRLAKGIHNFILKIQNVLRIMIMDKTEANNEFPISASLPHDFNL